MEDLRSKIIKYVCVISVLLMFFGAIAVAFNIFNIKNKQLESKLLTYEDIFFSIFAHNITSFNESNCYELYYSYEYVRYNKTLDTYGLYKKIRIMADTKKSFSNGTFSIKSGVYCGQ